MRLVGPADNNAHAQWDQRGRRPGPAVLDTAVAAVSQHFVGAAAAGAIAVAAYYGIAYCAAELDACGNFFLGLLRLIGEILS